MPVNDGLEYGETANGYVTPLFIKTREWVARRAVERFGKNARTESTSRLGWIIDRIAYAMHVCFEGAAGAYNAAFYLTAKGTDLDKQLAIVAFTRLGETKSTGELVLYGADLTVVPQGSRIATEDTGQAYETNAAAPIGKKVIVVEITAVAGTGDAWKTTVNADPFYAYVQQAGDELEDVARGIAAAIGAQADYTASYLGTRPGGGHLLVIDSTGPDLTVVPEFIAPGSALAHNAVRAAITAAEFGPTPGFADTINDIRNPVFGWTGAVNQLDVNVGRYRETDAAYRARWDRERFGPGKATQKAMKRALLADDRLRAAVKAIRIDEVPMQTFTVLLYVPDPNLLSDDEIGQIIWDNKPLGVATDGNTTVGAIDINDEPVEVKFSHATVLYVWLKITITKGEGFPTLGDPADAIAREIASWGNGGPSPARPLEAYVGFGLGEDLDRFQLGGPINKAVAGVKNAVITVATQAEGDPDPGPGDYVAADLVVDADTVLVFDSSQVEVTIP